jgi:signal transduction histidine kinase
VASQPAVRPFPPAADAEARDLPPARGEDALRQNEERLELVLRRSEEERQALLEIAKELSGTLDLVEMVAAVERRTAEVLPADAAATIYWDTDFESYRMISVLGLPPEVATAAQQASYTFGENFGGALARGETVVVYGAEDWEAHDAELLSRFDVRAIVAVPLIIRGQVRGAFCVAHRSRPFSSSQVHFLEGIARQLAVAVETAALYRAQQAEAEYSAALARVGQELMSSLTTPEVYERLCVVTSTVLACEVSATFLWNAREQAYAPMASSGDSAERWEQLRVMRLTAPMVSGLVTGLGATGLVRLHELAEDDPVRRSVATAHGLTAAILVGLHRKDELIGFLCAGYRREPGRFSAHQERIARGIAQVASLALENARLVEELERANRVKSDFVATMSHELRTPLSVVIGYHDLLLEGEFGALSEEQADRLRRADRSARELLDLINATLDLSRLESRQVPLELAEVDLGALIDALTVELGAVRERSRAQFAWRLPPVLPRLRSDALKLKIVLKNLLHNAFKFTEDGLVTVTVSPTPASPTPERVEFEVADTGVGISPELLDSIFEPFQQADSSSTRTYGGVGLGLFIVRRLLDLLGGGIEVESEPGRGSRFRFWIPIQTKSNER